MTYITKIIGTIVKIPLIKFFNKLFTLTVPPLNSLQTNLIQFIKSTDFVEYFVQENLMMCQLFIYLKKD